jgi:hypothetical protein
MMSFPNNDETCAADFGSSLDMARALNLFDWLSANPWLELSARIKDYGEVEWVVYYVDYHEDKFYEWTELSCAEWPMDALEIAMHKTITKSNESCAKGI